MPYNLDFLEPTDTLDQAQPGMLDNFTAIDALISQDHVTFGAADEGKHKQITYSPVNAVNFPIGNDLRILIGISSMSNLIRFLITQSGGSGVKGLPDYFIDRGSSGFMSLASGLIIKFAVVDNSTTQVINNAVITNTISWKVDANNPAFGTQLWASAFPFLINGEVDLPLVYYVSDISNPLQVELKVWWRDVFSNQVGIFNTREVPRHKILLIGLGIP